MQARIPSLERLSPTAYVLLVGALWGTISSLPGMGWTSKPSNPIIVAGIWSLAALSALIISWGTVRRRRYSVWATAWHATLALTVANLIASSASLVYAFRIGEMPASFHPFSIAVVENTLFGAALLAPFRFVEATVLIAVGRLLPGSGRFGTPRPTRTAPTAVT